jgi:hypothetical protein
MRPQQMSAFETDGAVAKRSAFRAAGDDSDVLGHKKLLRISDFRLQISEFDEKSSWP